MSVLPINVQKRHFKNAGVDAVQAEKRTLGAFQDLEYSVLGKRKVYSSCKEASEANLSYKL